MKIILPLGSLVLGLSLLLTGCGSACDAKADAIAAKNAECNFTPPKSSNDSGTCSELEEQTADCDIVCIENVSCDGYTDKDTTASFDFFGCQLDCLQDTH